ncbi:MAG: hypothetical protein IKJ43_00040 [Bacilli bacterium]|nr:hypothetical protein [Bacilli bacterium]
MEENFEQYMDYYKKLPLKTKQKIVINQLKMLAQMTNKMCKELEVDNEIIMNQELLDISKDNYTEDDYSEALIVLINSIQNSICDFDLKLTELLENGEL